MGKNNQQRRRMKTKSRRAGSRATTGRPEPHGGAAHPSPSWWRDTATVEAGNLLGLGGLAEAFDTTAWIDELISVGQYQAPGSAGLAATVRQLVELGRDPRARRTVAQRLTARLQDGVTQAWRGGWQPADLHRLAGRKLTAAEQQVLDDAIAQEVSTYAPATVDPRWHGQLREADVRVWWPPDQIHLLARAGAGHGLEPALRAGLQVAGLLAGLPRLEAIGPLPGQATPVRSQEQTAAADVDERILSRVRALLAKAESTTFEAEAETFTARAQTLMARHSIDAALLASDPRRAAEGAEARRVGIDQPYESPKSMLFSAVADANRCRTVWSRDLGFVTVVGHAVDLDAVETLFTSLLIQATSTMTRAGSRTDAGGRSRTRAFRHTFLSAYAVRIGERLREVTRAETEAADRDAKQAGGRELVPLLSARSAEVDAAVSALFPELRTRTVNLGRDAEGWHSGRAAADQAALGRGGPIEG